MFKLPAQTSYFSVEVTLDTNTAYKTAIAIDILRTYYKQLSTNTLYNVRVFAIPGYANTVSFDELLLSIWLVFDKLFGYHADEIVVNTLTNIIGWNGEVTNPMLDIPMALEMYDELSTIAASRLDKDTRFAAIQKWFYKDYGDENRRKFFNGDYQHYDDLETINPDFYKWLIKKCIEVNKVSYVDWKTVDRTDLLYLAQTILLKSKFYLSFLTALENALYSATYMRFPVRLYGLITYLYNIYMKLIVNFAKPYHAWRMPGTEAGILIVGPDLGESMQIEDYPHYYPIKRFVDRVVKWPNCNDSMGIVIAMLHLFDTGYYSDMAWKYDVLYQHVIGERPDDYFKIRDFIAKTVVKRLEEIILTDERLDKDHLLTNTMSAKDLNNHQLDIQNTRYNNIYRLQEQDVEKVRGYSTFDFFGRVSVDWKFWMPMAEGVIPHDVLDWDIDNNTVTNNWNRDIILVSQNTIELGTDVRIDDIFANMSEKTKVGFFFEKIGTYPNWTYRNFDSDYISDEDLVYDDPIMNGVPNNWGFTDTWNRSMLPVFLDVVHADDYWNFSWNSDGTKSWYITTRDDPDGIPGDRWIVDARASESGETFDEYLPGKADYMSFYPDLQSTTDIDHIVTSVKLAVYLPIGESFTQLSGYVTNTQEIRDPYLPHQNINMEKSYLNFEISHEFEGMVNSICFNEDKSLMIQLDDKLIHVTKDFELIEEYDISIKKLFTSYPFVYALEDDQITLSGYLNGELTRKIFFDNMVFPDRMTGLTNNIYYAYNDQKTKIRRMNVNTLLKEDPIWSHTLAITAQDFDITSNKLFTVRLGSRVRIYKYLGGAYDESTVNSIGPINDYKVDKLNRWLWFLKSNGNLVISDYNGNMIKDNGIIVPDINNVVEFYVDNSQAIYVVDKSNTVSKYRVNI
jgi:hypothetical protein